MPAKRATARGRKERPSRKARTLEIRKIALPTKALEALAPGVPWVARCPGCSSRLATKEVNGGMPWQGESRAPHPCECGMKWPLASPEVWRLDSFVWSL